MSEHLRVTGHVEYDHLPLDAPGGLTWCHHCKSTMSKAEIGLHNGITSDWMAIRCQRCKKVIWTAQFNMKQERLNRVCCVCRSKTSYNNAACVSFVLGKGKAPLYYCSEKCYKMGERGELK